jgi:predicted nucleic-acid-binding protein
VIGVDTNILLRLATGDDAGQVARIRRWIAAHAQDLPLYVNHVVLAEAAWTLKSAYRIDRAGIARFVDALLGNADFEVEGVAEVEEALQSYVAGGADFPDCLIAAKNARLCPATITFDRGATGLPRVTLLA